MQKEDILVLFDQPGKLEQLYRSDKSVFKREFNALYPDVSSHPVARAWHERLNYNEELNWGAAPEWRFLIAGSLIAILIAHLNQIFGINEEFFYTRNLVFVFLPVLAAWFCIREKMLQQRILFVGAAILVSVVFINTLPDNNRSDTVILTCIHLPLFLWTILGFAYTGNQTGDFRKRIDYLRYNGDLLVMSGLILAAGGLMTLLTFGLFSMIGMHIEEFYFKYVIVSGLAAVPIVGTFLVQTNPQLVNKVSPVIARVFTPLVLITLVVYLIAIAGSAKNPYNDREFLMVFNVMLIAVMAIVLFSIVETSKSDAKGISRWMLLALAVVTILVNGIALSAILLRISEWGITPNRLAVMGGNVLMLIHLLMVTIQLGNTVLRDREMDAVEKTITNFLPVYSAWTVIAAFLFPVLFGFK